MKDPNYPETVPLSYQLRDEIRKQDNGDMAWVDECLRILCRFKTHGMPYEEQVKRLGNFLFAVQYSKGVLKKVSATEICPLTP